MNLETSKIKIINKAIAEFMAIKNKDGTLYLNKEGGYPEGTLHFNFPKSPVNYLNPEGHQYFNEFYGEWQDSWNWLMPVIVKIESLGFIVSNDQADTTILEKKAFATAFIRIYGTFSEMTKFESLYRAVYDFIQWYNKNDKK